MAKDKKAKQTQDSEKEVVVEEVKEKAEEITFVAPHDVYRVPVEGEIVSMDDLHVVLKTEDGKKYAIPYVQAAHKDAKVGDKLKF